MKTTASLMKYSNRVRVIRLLLIMSLACCVLTGVRVYLTQNYSFIYMIWNLFLAWIPLLIAYKLQALYDQFPKRYTLLALCGSAWLLFFPNSPYLITDLIHLDAAKHVPLWFDATLLFTFALTGLFAGFISLYFVHEILDCCFDKMINWGVITCIFLLTGYGIYLGRVLRWNSWDLFTRPKPLLRDVTTSVYNPQAIFMTLVFSFVMIFSYLILHSIIHLKHQVEQNDQNKQMH